MVNRKVSAFLVSLLFVMHILVAPAQAAGLPPVAVADLYFTDMNTALSVSAPGLLANDYDPDDDSLIINQFTPPDADTGTVNVNTSGSFIFTPAPGFVGTAIFHYRISDGSLFSSHTIVTIIVGKSLNRPPIPLPDLYWTDLDTTLTISSPGLLANDYDPDGDNFFANSFLPPPASTGEVTSILTSGGFVFDPEPDFVGATSFQYRLSDGSVFSEYGMVTIYVGLNPGTELVTNGSFETPGSPKPAVPHRWIGTQLTGDQRICNKPDQNKFYALNGSCAFRFKGSPDEASVLTHNVIKAHIDELKANDMLTANAHVLTKTIGGVGKLEIIAFYKNGSLGNNGQSKKQVMIKAINNDDYYRPISTPPLTVLGKVTKVVVMLSYSGNSGSYLIDSVSVSKNGDAVPLAMPLTLPPNPSDERPIPFVADEGESPERLIPVPMMSGNK